MIPEAGQRFGPYEILGRLGRGGMGLVFRAWDQRLRREVAIKLLHDDYVIPGMRERFLQEARAASALNHPNICTVFDIGEQEGEPYLVMELLEGQTLRDRIVRGALPPEEIVRYAAEVADALSVAHARGIVHRDIKPANIFLVKTPDGRHQAKVLDFGLAKIELAAGGGWESRSLDLNLHGATVGTLAYMSPEQARGESLDGRSDLFSLGAVMYEMATRRVPFKGTTSAVVFRELFDHDPEPIRVWNESIPRDLERTIDKLLAKNRLARFQTAKELREALVRIGEKLSKGRWLGRTTTAVPLVQAPDPIARQRRPKRTSGDHDDPTPTPEPDASSSAKQRLLRALHLPERKPPIPLPLDTEATPPPLHEEQSLAHSSDSSAHVLPAREPLPAVPILTHPHSDIAPFDYGPADLDTQAALEDKFYEPNSEDLSTSTLRTRNSARMAILVALVIFAIGGFFLLRRAGLFRPLTLKPNDCLLLTTIENKTPDKTLDGTIMPGLELALQQSNAFNLLGGAAYRAGLEQIGAPEDLTAPTAQRIAQNAAATAYLTGEIEGAAAPYTITVNLHKTASNRIVSALEETAATRDQIPAAIERLASALRAELGDPTPRHASAAQPATSSIDALHAYAVAQSAAQTGQIAAALTAYRQAVALDPQFIQAHLQLSWLYRGEKAELASAASALLALKAAEHPANHASDKLKLMASFGYELNTIGDSDKALVLIRTYVDRFPHDPDGMTALAKVLRLQGYLPEALLAAQQSYTENPYRAQAYTEAELALIGLDRSATVVQLTSQARHMGLTRTLDPEVAAYLNQLSLQSNLQPTPAPQQPATIPPQPSFAQLIAQARTLDNTGRTAEGLDLWRAAAATAGETPDLASTQSYLLAQAALDRAILEDCAPALKLVFETRDLPKGPEAAVHAAMAAGLCGDDTYVEKTIPQLTQDFPHNTALNEHELLQLQAAGSIGINEPAKALQQLQTLQQSDDTGTPDRASFTDYLRALAYLASGQKNLALAAFQSLAAHPGALFLTSADIVPMSRIELARTYTATGDKPLSRQAYQLFTASWPQADPTQPHLLEAAKSR